MNEKQRANLKPWKPGQSGNPSGRPKTAPVREAFLRRAEAPLPDCVKAVIEKSGFTLPRKANFLDGVAAVLFASALKGNVGAARVIHDVIEGERVVIPDEGYGTGQVREAINRIRELYGLEKIVDAAVPVKALPEGEGEGADKEQATVTAAAPDAVSIGGTATEAEASLGRAGDGADAGG